MLRFVGCCADVVVRVVLFVVAIVVVIVAVFVVFVVVAGSEGSTGFVCIVGWFVYLSCKFMLQ